MQTPPLPTVYDEAVRLVSESSNGSNDCSGRLEIYSARRGDGRQLVTEILELKKLKLFVDS